MQLDDNHQQQIIDLVMEFFKKVQGMLKDALLQRARTHECQLTFFKMEQLQDPQILLQLNLFREVETIMEQYKAIPMETYPNNATFAITDGRGNEEQRAAAQKRPIDVPQNNNNFDAPKNKGPRGL